MSITCYNCESRKDLTILFEYPICNSCLKGLYLHSDATITRNNAKYQKAGKSYQKEVVYRLNQMEKDYISKRIKLLHILERLS